MILESEERAVFVKILTLKGFLIDFVVVS